MDTRIPLAVQVPDFAGSMMNGLAAGGAAMQAGRTNSLNALYQAQGPQIMAGDPNALGALARMDPVAAQGVQMNQLGMEQTRQGMAFDAEKMQMIRTQAKDAAAAAAAQADAAKLTAEIDQTKRVMAGAAPMLLAWKQGDPAAQKALIDYLGRNGIPVDPNNIEATLYAMQGGLEGLSAGLEVLKQQAALMPEQTPAPVWTPATPDQAAQYGAAGGQINTATGEFKPINPPSGGIQFDPETGRVVSIGGAAGSGKPLTEAEGKNAGFYIRMKDSGATLDQLEAQGTDLGAAIMSNDPTGLSNYAQTPEYQRYDQAKRDFINALLRRESGAVISPEEFSNAEVQYFPRPGDSPEVIAQKRKNRENAIAGVAVGAGKASENPVVRGSAGVSNGNLDFSTMDVIQLGGLNISELTAEQADAVSARLKELGF